MVLALLRACLLLRRPLGFDSPVGETRDIGRAPAPPLPSLHPSLPPSLNLPSSLPPPPARLSGGMPTLDWFKVPFERRAAVGHELLEVDTEYLCT